VIVLQAYLLEALGDGLEAGRFRLAVQVLGNVCSVNDPR
jgi:hypothetical protein